MWPCPSLRHTRFRRHHPPSNPSRTHSICVCVPMSVTQAANAILSQVKRRLQMQGTTTSLPPPHPAYPPTNPSLHYTNPYGHAPPVAPPSYSMAPMAQQIPMSQQMPGPSYSYVNPQHVSEVPERSFGSAMCTCVSAVQCESILQDVRFVLCTSGLCLTHVTHPLKHTYAHTLQMLPPPLPLDPNLLMPSSLPPPSTSYLPHQLGTSTHGSVPAPATNSHQHNAKHATPKTDLSPPCNGSNHNGPSTSSKEDKDFQHLCQSVQVVLRKDLEEQAELQVCVTDACVYVSVYVHVCVRVCTLLNE